MSYRSFSGNQIVMLLTLHFNFFPTVFLRKEKNTEKKKGRKEGGSGVEERGRKQYFKKEKNRKKTLGFFI